MKLIILACLAVTLVLSACRQDLESVEKGNPAAARKVLVAGSASEFKLNVVRAAIAELGGDAWYFKIVGLDRLADEAKGSFGALVLVDSIQGGRLDKRVLRYLDNAPTGQRAIVFFTRGGGAPLPADVDRQVDALASASAAELVGPRAHELAAMISARFKPAAR